MFNATSISQRQSKFNDLCNYCKKPGHKVANCFKREQANSRSNIPKTSNKSSFEKQRNSGNRNDTKSNKENSKSSGFGGRASRTDENAVSLYNGDSDSTESNTLELKQQGSVID